ncbi:DinB superfamily protein [Paenibacillus sophorae]|uniref:DinB family protein n=1 Tax=Paenibacillus sophorae TaxID=1333845 RepID=A0A1H8N7K5_9BACL|nr:DinB family protein [Paenibacillus sophorae]QWU14749.1 DinB family protein [Paenibacillus sophorae]SEO25536.1 DinB superfamily protein [Paenibacillus sophorae]
MNQRPLRGEYAESNEKYLKLVPEKGELADVLLEQSKAAFALFEGLTEEQGNYRYAPEKWSLKQLLGHLTDSDRIFSYRVLRISRGDQTSLPGYDENDFVNAAGFDSYSLEELIGQFKASRQSTLALLAAIPEEAWTRKGSSNGHRITARAQACLLIGHELHHLNIIKERYLY